MTVIDTVPASASGAMASAAGCGSAKSTETSRTAIAVSVEVERTSARRVYEAPFSGSHSEARTSHSSEAPMSRR